VLDPQLIRHQLLPAAVMPRNDAGNGLRALVSIADAQADVVANPEPLSATAVIDLDLNRADREQLAGLPRPREVRLGVAAQSPAENPLERLPLFLGRSRVEIEDPAPGRALLVVAVANGQSNRLPGHVDSV